MVAKSVVAELLEDLLAADLDDVCWVLGARHYVETILQEKGHSISFLSAADKILVAAMQDVPYDGASIEQYDLECSNGTIMSNPERRAWIQATLANLRNPV